MCINIYQIWACTFKKKKNSWTQAFFKLITKKKRVYVNFWLHLCLPAHRGDLGWLRIQVVVLLHRFLHNELHRLTAACSQEWPWPTWTRAWPVTRPRPLWTPVRESTCWTWSPLALPSRRLQTRGNNCINGALLFRNCVQAPHLPITWSAAPPQDC